MNASDRSAIDVTKRCSIQNTNIFKSHIDGIAVAIEGATESMCLISHTPGNADVSGLFEVHAAVRGSGIDIDSQIDPISRTGNQVRVGLRAVAAAERMSPNGTCRR